jgi:hypothetical protein
MDGQRAKDPYPVINSRNNTDLNKLLSQCHKILTRSYGFCHVNGISILRREDVRIYEICA